MSRHIFQRHVSALRNPRTIADADVPTKSGAEIPAGGWFFAARSGRSVRRTKLRFSGKPFRRWLTARGVKSGQIVCLELPKMIEAYALAMACIKIGAPCGRNPGWATGSWLFGGHRAAANSRCCSAPPFRTSTPSALGCRVASCSGRSALPRTTIRGRPRRGRSAASPCPTCKRITKASRVISFYCPTDRERRTSSVSRP